MDSGKAQVEPFPRIPCRQDISEFVQRTNWRFLFWLSHGCTVKTGIDLELDLLSVRPGDKEISFFHRNHWQMCAFLLQKIRE